MCGSPAQRPSRIKRCLSSISPQLLESGRVVFLKEREKNVFKTHSNTQLVLLLSITHEGQWLCWFFFLIRDQLLYNIVMVGHHHMNQLWV